MIGQIQTHRWQSRRGRRRRYRVRPSGRSGWRYDGHHGIGIVPGFDGDRARLRARCSSGARGPSRIPGRRGSIRSAPAATPPAPDLVDRIVWRSPRTGSGWPTSPTFPWLPACLSLAVVPDAFSRRIVGWAMANHLRPDGFRSLGPGASAHVTVAFGRRCQEAGGRPTMGPVGDAYDTAMAESVFASRPFRSRPSIASCPPAVAAARRPRHGGPASATAKASTIRCAGHGAQIPLARRLRAGDVAGPVIRAQPPDRHQKPADPSAGRSAGSAR